VEVVAAGLAPKVSAPVEGAGVFEGAETGFAPKREGAAGAGVGAGAEEVVEVEVEAAGAPKEKEGAKQMRTNCQ